MTRDKGVHDVHDLLIYTHGGFELGGIGNMDGSYPNDEGITTFLELDLPGIYSVSICGERIGNIIVREGEKFRMSVLPAKPISDPPFTVNSVEG
jgi:hypothetical protein